MSVKVFPNLVACSKEVYPASGSPLDSTHMLTAAARRRGTAEHRQDRIFYLEHKNTDCLIQASRYLFISI